MSEGSPRYGSGTVRMRGVVDGRNLVSSRFRDLARKMVKDEQAPSFYPWSLPTRRPFLNIRFADC